ncbi:MAG: LysR family transcriptional regulator [Suipraeoptans sp.]
MKLSQLRYFQTICKYHNITRAAQELHVSQPSLSNVIKDLEKEFGVTLFHRLSKGLFLTEEGTFLLERATDLLAQADNLISEMSVLGSSNHKVKLGLPPMLGSLLFPNIMQTLQLNYPNTNIAVLEHGSITNKSLVQEGSIDAAIISGNDPLPYVLDYVELCTLNILFYISIESPTAIATEININQLQNVPLVLLKEDSFITSFVMQRFKDHDILPNIILNTNQLNTIEKLVANNTAASFLFEGILSENEDIVAIPLIDPPKVNVRLIWNKNRKQSIGTKNLIRLMQNSIELPSN